MAFVPPTPAAIAELFPPLRAHLDDAGMEALAGALRLVRVPPGEEILIRGSPHPRLYLLWDGYFTVSLGDDLPIASLGSLGPGTIVGEVSFVDGGPVSATVSARSRGSVLELTTEALDRLAAERPATAAALYRALSEVLATRIRKATHRLELAAPAPAPSAPEASVAATPPPASATAPSSPVPLGERAHLFDRIRSLFGLKRGD